MSELQFSFTRRAALATLILIPTLAAFMCLIGLILLLVVWSGALSLQVHERRLLLFVLPLFSVFFLHLAASLLRGRETFFTVFRITEAGVQVENRRYGKLLLSWDDVSRASYSRLQKFITLRSPRLRRPLRIVSTRRERPAGTQLQAARTILQRHLGTRWSERWL
jgi:hypothetical protein